MFYPLLFSLIFCLATTSNGIIVEHDSIQAIENYIPHTIAKEDVLVVLDLDDTVGMSVLDPTFSPWFNKVLVPRKNQPRLSLKERINYILQLKPMESCTVTFLKGLQAQQIPVIILTARVANLHLRTHAQITRIGLDLSTSLKLENHTIEIPTMIPTPFHQGILLCSKQDKGIVLHHFMKKNNLAPKKIIFVDDTLENIQAVDAAMRTATIDCTAIHYTRKKEYGLMGKIKYSFKTLFGYTV